jgi:hypothetical protein
VKIDGTMLYPIRVQFPDEKVSYALDGKQYESDATPILYAEKPEITLPKWQPKEGEWCWFWDYDNKNACSLRQFQKKIGEYYLTKLGSRWSFCAPFIGELPEHLKEVKP